MEEVKIEYSLYLDDYLEVEKFAFMDELNEDYKQVKKNIRLYKYVKYWIVFMIGVTLTIYSEILSWGMLSVIIVIFLFVRDKKNAKQDSWGKVEKVLRKNIILYQFNGDENGIHNCCLIGSNKHLKVQRNDGEQYLYNRCQMRKIIISDDYFLFYDTRKRGMCVPISKLDLAERDYFENLVHEWNKTERIEERSNDSELS